MASFQGGTCSGYEGIASYRSYLDLSMNDIEFSTGLRNPLYFSEKSTHHENFGRKTMEIPAYGGYVAENSNYSIIRTNKNTNKFREFVELHKLQNYIDTHKASTIFVPVDSNEPTGVRDLFKLTQVTALTPKDVINFHTLDYILEPVELYNKILRIQPLLLGQTFLTKGTSIINEHDDRSPNAILQSIKTKSGYMYLMERPLIPYLY